MTDEKIMDFDDDASASRASSSPTAVVPVEGPLVHGAVPGAHAGSGSLDHRHDAPPPPPPPTTLPSVWVPPPPAEVGTVSPIAVPGLLTDQSKMAVLDAMPVAVLVIDPDACVRFLNDRAAELIGVPRTELLGRSVLDFVGVEDLDFVVELMNGGAQFETRIMGPSRVRYADAAGDEHWTQVWAVNAPDDVCPGGFVVTLTNESVRDVLSVTATTVAADSTLEYTLNGVAESARGLPLAARGAVLTVEATAPASGRPFRLIGSWPIDHRTIDDPSMPWRRALEDCEPCDVADIANSDLPGDVRRAFRDADIAAVFARPIPGADSTPQGVFVVFRSLVGAASVNQNDHIDDAIQLAGFAFTMARRQVELKQASYTDALTGLANRAAFNDRLRSERRATDVLFIDLDRFKDVNDTYGHEVGDRVLAMASERIESTLRRGARAFRTGGDEFIVLAESSGDDPAERIALAERIVDVLMTPFDVDIHRVRIGATVGIAASGTRSVVDTVRAADTALYRAKRRGRSGWAHEGR